MNLVYVGIGGCVVALDPQTGNQVWSTRLKGSEFVNTLLVGDCIYATTRGEIFCLNAQTGEGIWHNRLKGYGTGLATLAVPGASANPAAALSERKRRDQQQATAAAAAAS